MPNLVFCHSASRLHMSHDQRAFRFCDFVMLIKRCYSSEYYQIGGGRGQKKKVLCSILEFCFETPREPGIRSQHHFSKNFQIWGRGLEEQKCLK